jgi:uncharacterized protein (TIGR00369 family)
VQLAREASAMTLGCGLFDGLPHRISAGDGGAVIELDLTDDVRGPGGSLHGGVLASLMDVAGALAVTRTSSRVGATSALSVSYLAGARVGPIRAAAEVLRVGASHGVAEVRVHDAGKGDRLVAVGHVTVTFLAGDDYQRIVE